MPNDLIFQIAGTISLMSWIFLFIFYKKDWCYIVLLSGVVLAFSVIYAILLGYGLSKGGVEGGFGSLDEVALLFSNREALLAGWIHYLAFDLFVGMWEARDAHNQAINRWVLLPCLFFTFMAGPFGLLLYLIIRSIHLKKITHAIAQ